MISDFPCYLIGQLSKNSAIKENFIDGEYLVECKNNSKLLKFYTDNQFTEIAQIPDGNDEMIQMIRKLV